MTKDKQVEALLEKKDAFSAGGLWRALSFTLLGLRATCQAQVMQIEREKKSNDETVAKNANELHLKVEKADETFQVFKSSGKMT